MLGKFIIACVAALAISSTATAQAPNQFFAGRYNPYVTPYYTGVGYVVPYRAYAYNVNPYYYWNAPAYGYTYTPYYDYNYRYYVPSFGYYYNSQHHHHHR
jgi:hypothetical protein